MRSYLGFVLTAVMTLGLFFLLVTRVRLPYDAPPEVLEAKATSAGDGGTDATAPEGRPAGLASGGTSPSAAPPAPAVPQRPIRVTALGWELVAPAATPVAVPMEVAPETSLDAVCARLARGGEDPLGADVALIPLPSFVVAYERVRALDPQAFLVVGFSHGREEIHASSGALLSAPPGGDEVKLVGLGSGAAPDPAMQAGGSEAATLLGLFALDLLGVPPSRVRLVAPGTEAAKTAPFAAVVRGTSDDRKLAFTSADASGFVPIVAVAPRAQLEARRGELEGWSRAWLAALETVKKDVPGAARKLAAKEGVPLSAAVGGAPEALALVDRLGQLDGGSGGGVDMPALRTLFQRTWQLARGAALTTISAPDPLPVDERILAAIGGLRPPLETPPAPSAIGAVPAGSTPILVVRSSTSDGILTELQLLSGVFGRAVFRVSAKGGEKAALAVATTAMAARKVDGARLAAARSEPKDAFVSIEILLPP
jgi:hypothetical protein